MGQLAFVDHLLFDDRFGRRHGLGINQQSHIFIYALPSLMTVLVKDISYCRICKQMVMRGQLAEKHLVDGLRKFLNLQWVLISRLLQDLLRRRSRSLKWGKMSIWSGEVVLRKSVRKV